MSALELETETELAEEIHDLSSYLGGIPAELRESGAFTPYEVRLQQLRESLLVLRVQQTLQRYARVLAHETNRANLAQHQAVYELQLWLRDAERWHEDAAHGYLKTTTVLNSLVVAFGAAAGVSAFAAFSFLTPPLAVVAALMGALQLAFRPAEKSRAQQELADRLAMLRIELENIVAHRSSATSHEAAIHRVEHALQVLNETIVN